MIKTKVLQRRYWYAEVSQLTFWFNNGTGTLNKIQKKSKNDIRRKQKTNNNSMIGEKNEIYNTRVRFKNNNNKDNKRGKK